MDAACTRLVGTLEIAGAGPLPGGLGWRLGRGGGVGCSGGSLDPGSSILGEDRCGRDASRAETPGGGGRRLEALWVWGLQRAGTEPWEGWSSLGEVCGGERRGAEEWL